MNAETRGMAAQLVFESTALEKGWKVYRPVQTGEELDVLLLRTRDLVPRRVQIKRVYMKDGHWTINLKRKDGSRYKDLGFVAAVDVATRLVFLIPFSHLTNEKTGQPKGRLRLTGRHSRYVV